MWGLKMPIKHLMNGENSSVLKGIETDVSKNKEESKNTYEPNQFNKVILKIGRFATNPITAAVLLISFGYWLFNHGLANNKPDVIISALLEFTKGIFAFLAIFGCNRLYNKEKLIGWKMLSGACIFWFSGEMVYAVSIYRANESELPVSFADWFFLATIPLAILGVFSVGMHGLKRHEKLRIALDSLAIAGTLVFISLSFLIDTILARKEMLIGDATLQLTFVILDIIFASLAFSMLLYRRFDRMVLPIGIGMMFQALADVLYISDKLKDSLSTRPFTRTLLFSAAILYCYAAQRTNGRPKIAGSIVGDRRLRNGVFATVSCAIIFAAIKLPTIEKISPIVAFSFVALFVITLAGQIISHYENQKLTNLQSISLEAMTQSEEKFRIAFENGPTGLVIVSTNGTIVKANNAFGNLISIDPEDLIGQELLTHIHPEDREQHIRASIEAAQDKQVNEYEVRFIEREGSISWGSINLSKMSADSKNPYAIYQIEDINEQKTSSQKLEYIAVHDTLTGLANRAYFLERLDEELEVTDDVHQTMAVLFMDLDRFKTINDSLGHDVGDQVIQTIAQRISHVIGKRGIVARFGGDEFTILISGPTNESLATIIAGEILNEVTKPFLLKESETFISCSIGIVLTDEYTTSAQALLRDADSAMNRAKELGRNRIEIADRQVHKIAMSELKTVNELHRAVGNNEIRAFYQPIYNMVTKELSGFEALARWVHPTRGIVAPDDFIPMAEETGLIMDIGKHIMLEAFTQLGIWQKQYTQSNGSPLTMSVNLAARQLNSTRLMSDIVDVTNAIDVEENSTTFEITESAILSDTNNVETLLHDVHKMGFKLIIDDFGTGYSSLTYLKRFPIDGFKVDKSFVKGYDADEDDTAIVKSLIGLAKSMRLSVTSEGVETISVLKSLTELGCNFGQGFFFSKPLASEEINLKVLAKYELDDEEYYQDRKVDRRKPGVKDRRKASNRAGDNDDSDEKNEDDQDDHPQVINIETKFKSGS